MTNGEKFWDRLRRYPPVLIRLLARHKRGRPLTSAEISERSGLPLMTVETISSSTSWSGLDLYTARRFMLACGCDLSSQRDVRRIHVYLKRTPRNPRHRFPYLQRSPQWEGYYLPLMERFLKSLHERSQTHGPANAAALERPQVRDEPRGVRRGREPDGVRPVPAPVH